MFKRDRACVITTRQTPPTRHSQASTAAHRVLAVGDAAVAAVGVELDTDPFAAGDNRRQSGAGERTGVLADERGVGALAVEDGDEVAAARRAAAVGLAGVAAGQLEVHLRKGHADLLVRGRVDGGVAVGVVRVAGVTGAAAALSDIGGAVDATPLVIVDGAVGVCSSGAGDCERTTPSAGTVGQRIRLRHCSLQISELCCASLMIQVAGCTGIDRRGGADAVAVQVEVLREVPVGVKA